MPPLSVSAAPLSVAEGAAPRFASDVKSTTPALIVRNGSSPLPERLNVFVPRSSSVHAPDLVMPPVPVKTPVLLSVQVEPEAMLTGAPIVAPKLSEPKF